MDREERIKIAEAASDLHAALRTIVYARDLAPEEKIPTPLMVAIEAARRIL